MKLSGTQLGTVLAPMSRALLQVRRARETNPTVWWPIHQYRRVAGQSHDSANECFSGAFASPDCDSLAFGDAVCVSDDVFWECTELKSVTIAEGVNWRRSEQPADSGNVCRSEPDDDISETFKLCKSPKRVALNEGFEVPGHAFR